jgi:hypothetical protein
MKFCTAPLPVPVSPSPMKKTCLTCGANEEKLSPIAEKSRDAGAEVESGWLLSKKTPTRELSGALILEIPKLGP